MGLNKWILKFIWRGKRPNDQNRVRGEQTKGLTTDLTYCKARVVKLGKEHTDQGDSRKPRSRSVQISQTILDKRAKAIHWRKGSLQHMMQKQLGIHMQNKSRVNTFHKN